MSDIDYGEMLKDLYAESDISGTAMSRWEVNFIQDVYDQWINVKSLSEKQKEIIERIHDKMF